MSLAQFTLGARLRAEHSGRAVEVALYAPAIPPLGGIAVTVDSDGERVYITATDGDVTHAGSDRAGLEALAALGGRLRAHRHLCLAVHDRAHRVRLW